MRNFTMPILRIAAEGWVLLGLLAAAALLCLVQGSWVSSAGFLLLMAAAAVFFHDAPRNSPAKPLGILAPADGVVSFRRECHDPWLSREAIRIAIALPWFSNYLLRAPVEGELVAIEGAPRTVSCITTDEGISIVLSMPGGGLLGARPVWADFGERVGQGKRCGARRFARVIEVYLPAECRVEVQLGQAIRCGETVLATLLRRNP